MSHVILKETEGIATLSIYRPEAYNALNREIVDEIDKVIEYVRKNDDIRALIIHSEKNFAAGADIKDMIHCDEEEAKKFAFSGTFNKIEDLKIPTLAAISGYALGGGLELALTCDLRIASKDAKLGFPETGLGIMPGAGGTARTPRLIGKAKAMELILLASIIDADEALKIGLVNRISDPEKLLEDAMKWAKKLSTGAPIALQTAKQVINEGLVQRNIKDAVANEARYWANLFTTEDQKEGMAAFLEKRKPQYKGK
ncbi:MAG TPA: enoyl-CoA hydratase-related protein [Anaerovoracaceae bacterium]|nr:enoyl-CoA hydratase-related protein [Anaerovoracaceae bacterium]